MGPTSGSGASPSRSWCCSGCGEVHDFEWEACWKCGGARGEGLAAQVPASAPAPSDEPVEKKTGILSGLDRHSFGIVWALQSLCFLGAVLVFPAHAFFEHHRLWDVELGLVGATVGLLVTAVLLAVISRLVRRVQSLESRLDQRRGE